MPLLTSDMDKLFSSCHKICGFPFFIIDHSDYCELYVRWSFDHYISYRFPDRISIVIFLKDQINNMYPVRL